MVITILPPQKVTRKMRISNISNKNAAYNISKRRSPRQHVGGVSKRLTSSYSSEHR